MREKLFALCNDCGHGQVPQRIRGNIQCSECGSRDTELGTLDEILEKARRKASEEVSRTVKRDASGERAGARPQGRDVKRPRGRRPGKPARGAKPEDAEQPIHKRLGIKAQKLERIVAEFKDGAAGRRGELDENGKPVVAEVHNVNWIEIVGKVSWRTAHKIYHEVLMKGLPCELEIGYEPLD